MDKKQYAHCDFIKDGNRLLFFSYGNYPLEFNLNDRKMRFSEFTDLAICQRIEKPNAIERLIRIGQMLIAVSINGEELYVYDSAAKHWQTTEIGCHQAVADNYIDVAVNDRFVYVIPKYRAFIIKIDAQNREITKIAAPFLTQMVGQKTVVCMKGSALYFFESQSDRVLVFYPDTEKYREVKIECPLRRVASAQDKEGGFLILSEDGYLSRWAEESRCMEPVIEPAEAFGTDYFLEFAVTEKNIWLLPKLGEDIYVYERQNRTLKRYMGYPDHFLYLGPKQREKYLRGHEDQDRVYFGMHSASHFLVIHKKTGVAEWIEPIFPSEKDENCFLVKRRPYLMENNASITVETFLKMIVSSDIGLCNGDKNDRSRADFITGKVIYDKLNEVN